MSQSVSQSTIVPPRVRPGDTVGICAPGSPVPADRLQAGIDRLGGRYRIRVADDIARETGFLAGSDERRADELNGLLRDPDVRAVMMARGGHGLLRILDRLDADALRRDPKPIVGFSDGTALLFWALRAAGVRSIHGPVVAQLAELPPSDAAWLVDVLEGRVPAGLAADLRPTGAAAGRGRIEAPLLGGNLTLLAHLIGTPFAPELAGAILLVEEVTERPYAIDRYFARMSLAGALGGVAAALVGQFVRCEEKVKQGHPDAAAVVDEHLAAAHIAGLAGAPFGHGERNLAMPFGGRCALDFDARTAELIDPAVG